MSVKAGEMLFIRNDQGRLLQSMIHETSQEIVKIKYKDQRFFVKRSKLQERTDDRKHYIIDQYSLDYDNDNDSNIDTATLSTNKKIPKKELYQQADLKKKRQLMDYAALALPQTMTTNQGESKAMILKTNIHNEATINNYIDYDSNIDDDDDVSIAIENNEKNRYSTNTSRKVKTTPRLEVSNSNYNGHNRIVKQPVNVDDDNDSGSFEDDFGSDSYDEEVMDFPTDNTSKIDKRNTTTSNINHNNSSNITNGFKKSIINKTNMKSNNVTPSFNNINSVMNFAIKNRSAANNGNINKNIGNHDSDKSSTSKHVDNRKASDPPWWFKLAADIGSDIVALLEQSKNDNNYINNNITFDGNDIQNKICDHDNNNNFTMAGTCTTDVINSVVLLKGHDADDISKYYNQYGIILIKNIDFDENSMEICI